MAAAACQKTEVDAPCLAVPRAADLERVTIKSWTPSGASASEQRVDDPARVDALLRELREDFRGTCRTMETTRPQEATISFDGRDEVLLIVWVGADWIGGVDQIIGADRTRLARWKPLAPDAVQRLRALMKAR